MDIATQILLWALGILGVLALGFIWLQADEKKDKSLKWLVYSIIILLVLLSCILGD